MKKLSYFLTLALLLLLQLLPASSFACSMCKVTINGRTYLGSNEDSWRMGSRIWFENGAPGKLGALYAGYGNNFPQGGMNEAGLAFDGLTTAPKTISIDKSKKNISNPVDFIKEIMRTCKTVEEVKRYASQYNRQSFLNNGEFLFADRLGNYLVMEADTIISGNDDKYIIANFCPSITPDNEKLKWERYKRGKIFISNHRTDTNENYSLALIDTMHECRERIGDGTMYSFVADLEKTNLTLYFYHDFKHAVKFNLKEELKKGDHVLEIPALFPANKEFIKLVNYKTPQNSLAILGFLYLCGALFFFTGMFFLVGFFKAIKTSPGMSRSYASVRFLLFSLSAVLLYYLIVLVKNQNIFYLPAPYRDFTFSMLNIAAYIPFLLAIFIIPSIRWNVKVFRESTWNRFSKYLFALNNLTYLTLIVLFAYWGLYNVLS